MAKSLFSPALLLPSNDPLLLWRPLQINDYAKGFCSLLAQLTDITGLTKEAYEARWNEMAKANDALGPTYHVVVCEDLNTKKLVACGTLLVERKFIRNGGLCGHIEDIVVDASVRGKSLGLHLINNLKEIGRKAGCYKLILDCSDKNVPFYERCGFTKKELMMALYFPKAKL
eukprot:TRINITY_DN1591_c0_g1_i4.p1 TRINITY_DN1591_c0_g1~~TRINITY_DN1591_c0_g1_i4.p1  ORF type:complete len:180 (-),score=33.25 TRINITY_DN1591_c0_g1_i4:405-920(-)